MASEPVLKACQAIKNSDSCGVATVIERIQLLGLEVALHKSELEAMCFHGPQNAPPSGSQVTARRVPIGVERAMKLRRALPTFAPRT
ncbi:hypothetical protein B5X24_HaOG212858 [Helicoverpa armigera]|uniref:Uncharacterized protein n=1 Tax=Helicoverpa armigera TaxID=29058 RepID=A0A2W1BCT8_HELAM|nr:hypothetical protein B5X24_HaOG212858 [Helicoverpa armigera]